MKKFKLISFVLIAALLCGCSKSGSTSIASESSDKSSDFSQIENPFSENTESESVSEVIGSNSSNDGESSEIDPKYKAFYDAFPFEELSSGAGIIYDKIEWVDSETMKIPIYCGGYEPKETTRCGFILLCDGIVQEYSCDEADDNKNPAVFHTFKYINDTSDGSESIDIPTYWLTLKPKLDKNSNVHTITSLNITNVAYFGRLDNFGLNLNVNQQYNFAYKFDIRKASVEYADFKVYEAPKAEPLTDEQCRNLQINPNDTAYNYWPRIFTSEHAYDFVLQRAMAPNAENGKLKLKFVGGGGKPGKQKMRGSVYVNGKHTKFNGDYDYFEFTIEGGCVNDIDIELENINIGDAIFATAIPIDYAGNYRSCVTYITTVLDEADIPGNASSQS